MNTMKNDLASERRLSEGEERLLRELDAVREERNKTVDALLDACKLAKAYIARVENTLEECQELEELCNSLDEAIANAEK